MLFGFLIVLPLMLIIITGNILFRCGFLKESDVNCLTKVLFWVILPALLFKTSYTAGNELLKNKNLFVAALCAYVVTGTIAWFCSAVLFRRGTERAAASIMSSIRANNMYVGFPVIQMALGDPGLACAAVYMAATAISFHITSVAGAEIAMSGKLTTGKLKKIAIALVLNPLLISCAAGVSFSLLRIPVPKPILQTLAMFSNAATAVALLALGASLKLENLRAAAKLFAATWCDNMLRFAVAPVVMFCFMRIFHVDSLLATVTVLLTCMPAAVNCFVLAKGMGMDEKYMASVVASTTIVSAIAIPVWVMLLKIGQ